MRIGSPYGRSAEKQLVRPFLSSPLILLVYLLLVLSAVGLLEWVLRASANAQARHQLETRDAWLNQYYKNAALLPKRHVPKLDSAVQTVRLLRRQSGIEDGDFPTTTTTTSQPYDGETPTTTTTTLEVPPTTTPTTTSTTTHPRDGESPTTTTTTLEVPPTTTPTPTDPENLTPLTTTTTTLEVPPTTTPTPTDPENLTPLTTTTTTAVPPTTTASPPNDGETPTTTTTTPLPPPTTSTTSFIPNDVEGPTTVTTPVQQTTPTTSTTTTSPTSSTTVIIVPLAPPQPQTSTTTEEVPPTTTTSTPSTTATVIPVAPIPITTDTTSSESSPTPQPPTSSTPGSTSLLLVPNVLLSSSSSPQSTASPPSSSGTATPISSESALLVVVSSSQVSTSDVATPTTVLVIVDVSSTGSASTSQGLTTLTALVLASTNPSVVVGTTTYIGVAPQTTTLAISDVPTSISSIADMASTSSSGDAVTGTVPSTAVSGVQNSAATSTPLAENSCRHGLMCLFAKRQEAVPLSDNDRTLPVPVSGLVEFAATYAPILIILLFQTFWLIIYASIKLNEPFHQLAKPEGTPPSIGLNFEFLAIGFPLDHFKAGFKGNWTSWYMVTAYLVLLILIAIPSLAAEAFSIQNLKVYCVKGSGKDECIQRVWTIAVGPVRTLQVMLVLVAILVLIVFIVRTYRGSALSLKKVNLALIADTLTDPRTVDTLHIVNPDAPPEEAMPVLRRHLWGLEPSIATEIGTENASYVLRSKAARTATAQNSQFDSLAKVSKRFEPYRPLMDLMLPALIIVFLFMFISIYAANGIDDSKLTIFFGSVTFGPKFFLVSLCSILGMALCRVEYEVRIFTPYRSLYESLDPEPLLLRRLHPSPLTQAFAAVKHGEWVSAFIAGMAGFGTNILAMTMCNIPYHPGLSVRGTIVCIFVSLGLLISMAASLVAVAVWRKGNVDLPVRQWPISLADIYVLMVHSRIPGVQGIQGVEESQPNVSEFYGKADESSKLIVEQTVEVKESEDRSHGSM